MKRIILLMTLLSVVLFSIGGMDTTYDNHVNIKEKKNTLRMDPGGSGS
ncbi:hypothetical protein [Bacillus cereus]|nr:hypothetical protein [Bacillus cereus]